MCEPRRKAEWIFKLQWKQINFLPLSNPISIYGTTINKRARFVVIKICIRAGRHQVLSALYIFWIWASPYSLVPLISLAGPCAPLPAAWVTFVETRTVSQLTGKGLSRTKCVPDDHISLVKIQIPHSYEVQQAHAKCRYKYNNFPIFCQI